MDEVTTSWGKVIGGVLAGLLGLAIVAVILSGKSQTSNVIGAATSAFAKIIGAAVAPVSTAGSLPSAVTPENTAFTTGTTSGGVSGMIQPAAFVQQSGGGDGVDTASNVIGTIGKIAGTVALFA